MTRQSFISIFFAFTVVFAALPASAQEDPSRANDDGWAAFSGFAAFSAFFPLITIAGTLIYQPKHPIDTCRAQPELCKPKFGSHLLMGATIVGVLGLVTGGAILGRLLARELELSPELGWSLAGGLTGTAVVSMLYLSIPPWDPSWLHQTLGVLTIVGGGVATGFLFRKIALERGHAWPEFAFTLGGLVLGLGVGSLIYTPELNEYPIAPQLTAGIGALALGIGASLLWGYEPANGSASNALTLQVPLLQLNF